MLPATPPPLDPVPVPLMTFNRVVPTEDLIMFDGQPHRLQLMMLLSAGKQTILLKHRATDLAFQAREERAIVLTEEEEAIWSYAQAELIRAAVPTAAEAILRPWEEGGLTPEQRAGLINLFFVRSRERREQMRPVVRPGDQ